MVVLDDLWLPAVANPIGIHDLKWSHAANGGCEQTSWSMNLPPTFTHPNFTGGAIVKIKLGPTNLFQGVLNEPDKNADGWSMSAAGLASAATGYLCLDSAGNTTSTPDVAIDQAIARGLPWTKPTSLSNVPYAASDNTVAVNKLSDLLDTWALSQGKRWGVDADGVVYAVADPTTPTWYINAGAGTIGLADDDYASNLYGRYKSGPTSYATATASDATAAATNRREEAVDLTPLGLITNAKATAVLNGMLANGKARYAWTSALTLGRWQITTPGGQPACLSFMKAGDMARIFGLTNEQGSPTPYVDFVIGRTEYEAGTDTITVSPVNLAARNLGDVLAVAVGA